MGANIGQLPSKLTRYFGCSRMQQISLVTVLIEQLKVIVMPEPGSDDSVRVRHHKGIYGANFIEIQ
jgi:hypothetical protein